MGSIITTTFSCDGCSADPVSERPVDAMVVDLKITNGTGMSGLSNNHFYFCPTCAATGKTAVLTLIAGKFQSA